MNTKREANRLLMAYWAQAWTTLGRWQALNTRLSMDATAQDFGWARRSAASRAWHGVQPQGRLIVPRSHE